MLCGLSKDSPTSGVQYVDSAGVVRAGPWPGLCTNMRFGGLAAVHEPPPSRSKRIQAVKPLSDAQLGQGQGRGEGRRDGFVPLVLG